MKIYDITIPVTPDLAVWEGDTPYQFRLNWQMSEGASVNVGAITLSTHTGTHSDAPFHFLPEGATIGELDPSVYVGACIVVNVRGVNPITCDHLEPIEGSNIPRLLLRTDTWIDHTVFPDSIPIIAPDVPDFLNEQGVILLGVDVPSVDKLDSKHLPNHHALAENGIVIVESLDLRGVSAGIYTLIALPLRLTAADASPLRAILVEEGSV
jgi:arylformamidase